MTSPHEWQPGDEEVEKILNECIRAEAHLPLCDVRILIRFIIAASPYPRIAEDAHILLSFVPPWALTVPEGLDPTMYGTGTYEGDLAVKARVDHIRTALSALQPPATGGE